jgi:hypothetical protein
MLIADYCPVRDLPYDTAQNNQRDQSFGWYIASISGE